MDTKKQLERINRQFKKSLHANKWPIIGNAFESRIFAIRGQPLELDFLFFRRDVWFGFGRKRHKTTDGFRGATSNPAFRSATTEEGHVISG
jgi:hypothetical protein